MTCRSGDMTGARRVLSFPAVVRPGIEATLPQPEPTPNIVRCLFIGTRPRPERFNPVSMELEAYGRLRRPEKPSGGLWTCRDHPRAQSAWRLWDRRNDMGFTRYRRTWRLTAVNPRIYTIDTLADLLVALARWPHHAFPGERFLFAREIDFAAMAAEGYDAVELTEDGRSATYIAFPDGLYSWDIPCILWLRWAFSDVEPAPQRPGARRSRS
jgi:hypothetical protein